MTAALLPRITGPRASRKRLEVARLTSTILVTVIVAIQVYPLVWVLLASVKSPNEFAAGSPFALPSEFTLDNYARAWQMADLPRYIGNSFVVTLAANL